MKLILGPNIVLFVPQHLHSREGRDIVYRVLTFSSSGSSQHASVCGTVWLSDR